MTLLKSKMTVLLILSLGIFSANAQLRYEAPMNESSHQLWSTQSSRLACYLSYVIPEYGRADFYVSAGRDRTLSFEVFPTMQIGNDSVMRFIEASPLWNASGVETELGRINLYRGFNPFVGDTLSKRMLHSLYRGFEILMPYANTSSSVRQSIVPTLSPLGFKAKFKEFNDCQNGLYPYSFVDVNIVTSSFMPGTATFVPQSLHDVDNQIEYIKLDPSVKTVKIAVFTFGQKDAEANKELSKSRADAIKKYYTDKGIDPASIIMTQYHNENISTTKKLTEKDTLEARKVVVTIERDPYKIKYDKEIKMPDVGILKK